MRNKFGICVFCETTGDINDEQAEKALHRIITQMQGYHVGDATTYDYSFMQSMGMTLKPLGFAENLRFENTILVGISEILGMKEISDLQITEMKKDIEKFREVLKTKYNI